jgi:hypothetical protein
MESNHSNGFPVGSGNGLLHESSGGARNGEGKGPEFDRNQANQANQAGHDRFFESRAEAFSPLQDPGHIPGIQAQSPVYMDPFAAMPKKSKFAAGVLSFFIPGTGHFYLGLMQKGLSIMMLFILNIVAITYTVNRYEADNSYIPFVVLLGCLIPVIYFYNLFDALQSTDQVNAYRRAVQLGHIPMAPSGSDPLGRQTRGGVMGLGLIAIGFFLFLVSNKPAWLEDLFSMMSSYVGAVILIGAGLLLFLAETKKR